MQKLNTINLVTMEKITQVNTFDIMHKQNIYYNELNFKKIVVYSDY